MKEDEFVLVTIHRGVFGKEIDRMYVNIKPKKESKKWKNQNLKK